MAANESTSATGPHATDNVVGIDALLLDFSAGGPIDLNSVTIKWNGSDSPTTNPTGTYNDSDLSVLAWVGSSSAPVLTNAPIATLLSSGWKLIGNYADVGNQTGNTQTIASTTYSSYWMISAYSTAYGTSNSGVSGSNLAAGGDAFKILAIAGNGCSQTFNASTGTCGAASTTSRVPEPGSLALMGASVLGFAASRRRRPKPV